MIVFVLNTMEDILKNEGNTAVFLSYYVPQNSLITNFHTGLDLLEDRMVIFGCTVPLSRPRKHIKNVLPSVSHTQLTLR